MTTPAESEAKPDAAPAKNAPAKKTAARKSAKKAPAKKTAAKKAPAKKTAAKKASADARQAKFPRHPVEKALRIPKAIYDQNGGRPATREEAVRFAGGGALTGPWRVEISSAQKYGFLSPAGDGLLGLTDRARRAIAPQSETDRVASLREAVQEAPDVSDVYNYYRGEQLPDSAFFANALIDRFEIPVDKVAEFEQIFDESIRSAELLDESGPRPRLIDVGREDKPGKKVPGASGTAAVPAGATCFVMQPFSGALGSYYESIFKPAIAKAGLEPMRADASIFGTGKIIDQIWRGITSAQVLVAELTS